MPTAQYCVGTSQCVLLTGSKKNQSGAGVDDTGGLRQDRCAAIRDALVDAPVVLGGRCGGQRTKMIQSDIIG